MNASTRATIGTIGVIVGILGGAGGMVGAFVLLPHRMQAMERKVESLVIQREADRGQRDNDRELLTRIDERLAAVQRDLSRLNNKP